MCDRFRLMHDGCRTGRPGREDTTDEIHERLGRIRRHNELGLDNAKIVRTKGGVPEVTDGPSVEIKEIVAGYYIVECEGIDSATQIAGKFAEAEYGLVEVRQMTSQPSH